MGKGITVLCLLMAAIARLLSSFLDIPGSVAGGVIFLCLAAVMVINVPVVWKGIREKKKS